MENSKIQNWNLPPPNLSLSRSDVHIWRASLKQALPDLAFTQVLSPDERLRAKSFRFDRDRRKFVISRGILRVILGRYLNIEPRYVPFHYTPYGKPYLYEKFDQEGIQFNLAHSHELVLYAFTCARRIGIDLEYIRPFPHAEQIATNYFSANEAATLRSLPENQRLEAFFNCWTRKEAFVKAHGYGLSCPLDQFEVTLTPGEPARLSRVERDSPETTQWSLEALIPAPGYVAAWVVEGFDWHLRRWQFRGLNLNGVAVD